jgi:putative membrane protein
MKTNPKKKLAKDRTDWAQDRTDWAQERTMLAKERTLMAWGRTGISAMAAGLGISRFLGSVESPWLARTLGTVLILTGGVIYVLGFLSYRKALKKLAEVGVRGAPLWIIGVITFALMFTTVLALLLIYEE